MDKYKNGKIYTIRYKNDDSLIYVGSTIGPLHKRWYEHKSFLKVPKYENRQLYIKINETNIDDWYIELYEDFPCKRKEQLTQREGQVIREIATLNKIIAGRTKHEYYEENKEQILEKQKEYNENNKEQIKERISENILCECGCSTRRDSIARHKRTNKHLDIMTELAKTLEQTI